MDAPARQTRYMEKEENVNLRIRKFINSLVMALCLVSCTSYALQCENARGRAEQLVCGNPTLQSLDDAIQKVYDANADLVSDETLKLLRSGQRDWLVGIRDRCITSACLENAYSRRIDDLRVDLLNAYADEKSSPLILNARARIGSIAEILERNKVNVSSAPDLTSYGGSLPIDIRAEPKLDAQGKLIIELYSMVFEGVVVRYWDPLANIEWIPNLLGPLKRGDTFHRISNLNQFKELINQVMIESVYLKFASDPKARVNCPLSATALRVRSLNCYPAEPIPLKDSVSLTIIRGSALADCLSNFGESFYEITGKNLRTVRTPLIALNSPVLSLFGGSSYCKNVPEIGDAELHLRHRVLEPGLPKWAGSLKDGSVLILGGNPLQHWGISYFYRLTDTDLTGFQDKRMRLRWVDSDWLVTNGHLMGGPEAPLQRILNMDRILLKHIQE